MLSDQETRAENELDVTQTESASTNRSITDTTQAASTISEDELPAAGNHSDSLVLGRTAGRPSRNSTIGFHIDFESAVKKCGIPSCHMEALGKDTIWKECVLCLDQVPRTSFVFCPTCGKKACVGCVMRSVGVLEYTGLVRAKNKGVPCSFCRTPWPVSALAYFNIVHDAHFSQIPFELWTPKLETICHRSFVLESDRSQNSSDTQFPDLEWTAGEQQLSQLFKNGVFQAHDPFQEWRFPAWNPAPPSFDTTLGLNFFLGESSAEQESDQSFSENPIDDGSSAFNNDRRKILSSLVSGSTAINPQSQQDRLVDAYRCGIPNCPLELKGHEESDFKEECPVCLEILPKMSVVSSCSQCPHRTCAWCLSKWIKVKNKEKKENRSGEPITCISCETQVTQFALRYFQLLRNEHFADTLPCRSKVRKVEESKPRALKSDSEDRCEDSLTKRCLIM